MTDPTAVALRALAPLLKAAQTASNPLVTVKHGRREDRAAVYDRFIGACTAFYSDRGPSAAAIDSSREFMRALREFTEVARIDVNGLWRWWHWPMAVNSRLKRWWLAR